MSTKDCQKYREDLKAFADGELPAALRLRVEAHLKTCLDCQAEVTFIESIGQELRVFETSGEIALPLDLRGKLLARMEATKPESRPTLPWWKCISPLAIGGVGTVVTAATIALLFLKNAPETALETGGATPVTSAPAAVSAPGSAVSGGRTASEARLQSHIQKPTAPVTAQAQPTAVPSVAESVPPPSASVTAESDIAVGSTDSAAPPAPEKRAEGVGVNAHVSTRLPSAPRAKTSGAQSETTANTALPGNFPQRLLLGEVRLRVRDTAQTGRDLMLLAEEYQGALRRTSIAPLTYLLTVPESAYPNARLALERLGTISAERRFPNPSSSLGSNGSAGLLTLRIVLEVAP